MDPFSMVQATRTWQANFKDFQLLSIVNCNSFFVWHCVCNFVSWFSVLVHTDDPRLVCSDCKKRFHHPGQLSNHKPYCKANGGRATRNRPNGGGGGGSSVTGTADQGELQHDVLLCTSTTS